MLLRILYNIVSSVLNLLLESLFELGALLIATTKWLVAGLWYPTSALTDRERTVVQNHRTDE